MGSYQLATVLTDTFRGGAGTGPWQHDHDAEQRAFEALLRITDLYAVPSATNPATAEILVRHLDALEND